MAGRQQEIHAERDRKLETARNGRLVARKPLDGQMRPGFASLAMGRVQCRLAVRQPMA